MGTKFPNIIDDGNGTNGGDRAYSTKQEMENVTSQLDTLANDYIKNLINIDEYMVGYFDDPRSGLEVITANSGYYTSNYIAVEEGKTIIAGSLNSSNSSYLGLSVSFCIFLDKNKNVLSYSQSISLASLLIPSGCAYIRFTVASSATLDTLKSKRPMATYSTMLSDLSDMFKYYVPYGNFFKQAEIFGTNNVLSWKNKNWVSYGDSIAALGNVSVSDTPTDGWQKLVHYLFEMNKYYGRGIGGQTYTYNKKPWFANADGSYNSRDDNGDMTIPASFTIPPGTTAHYGYFCSWDRITTMIPSTIANSIDLVFLFGVNDSTISHTYSIPTFIPSATTDLAWSVAAENTLGGDYDITTLVGAVASTIMKLQKRCPNALIVLGTGFSGRGDDATPTLNIANYTTAGMNVLQEGEVVKATCNYFSTNCIDLWNSTGINTLNRSDYLLDVVHPNSSLGYRALARAVTSGLRFIIPRF